MADVSLDRICLNCGAPAPQSFCGACGQRSDTAVPTVRSLFREAVGAFFSFDSKLWRTLSLLFLRPGELTREFMEGRRASYLSPIQLYLWLQALVLFLYETVVPQAGNRHRERAFVAGGLILAGLFRVWLGRRDRPGALHFVAALHVVSVLVCLALLDSVALRIVLPRLGVPLSSASASVGFLILASTLYAYTVLAVRRAYAEPTWRAALKMIGVMATLWAFDSVMR